MAQRAAPAPRGRGRAAPPGRGAVADPRTPEACVAAVATARARAAMVGLALCTRALRDAPSWKGLAGRTAAATLAVEASRFRDEVRAAADAVAATAARAAGAAAAEAPPPKQAAQLGAAQP
jgi:hypothetical protein